VYTLSEFQAIIQIHRRHTKKNERKRTEENVSFPYTFFRRLDIATGKQRGEQREREREREGGKREREIER
jgi:hypothetical protein